MYQERFLQLLSRKFANEATIQELDEFKRIIDTDTNYKALYDNLQIKSSNNDFITAYKANRAYELLGKKLRKMPQVAPPADTYITPLVQLKKTPTKYYFLYASVAAIFITLFFTAIKIYNSGQAKSATLPHNEIATLKGQKSKILLPDGTQVWLNADSKISYPEQFAADIREVQLVGEAFFDVAHNKEKPFIIHTKEMNIKVLGTAFNVRAYPKDEVSEAALIRGSIEVSFPNRPNQNLILKPNEKIAVKNPAELLPENKASESSSNTVIAINNISFSKSDSTILETAWKNGRLVFDSKPFSSLAEDLERWYDVTIVIDNAQIEKKLFTANFNNETIEDVLHFLKLSYSFNYTYNKESKLIKIF